MTTTIALLVFIGLPLAALVGFVCACQRLKHRIKTKSGASATLRQTFAMARGGGNAEE